MFLCNDAKQKHSPPYDAGEKSLRALAEAALTFKETINGKISGLDRLPTYRAPHGSK